MELKGERELPAARERVWQALNDTAVLQRCIPGCESLAAAGEGRFDAAVLAAVGPVKARFKGNFSLAEVDAPQAYTLRFEGNGGATGFARGQARVTLEAIDAQRTRLSYAASAQVGGKLAQVGSRLVDAAAGAMADRFFTAFAAEFGPAPGAEAPPATQGGWWSRFLGWLRRLLAG
jgi:uncharacterized protein